MQKLADPATHDQLIAGLRGAATIIAEHGHNLPALNVAVTDRGRIDVQVPARVGDEATRRAAVDMLAELLGLVPAIVNGRFYVAGDRTWDVYTPLAANLSAAPIERGAAA